MHCIPWVHLPPTIPIRYHPERKKKIDGFIYIPTTTTNQFVGRRVYCKVEIIEIRKIKDINHIWYPVLVWIFSVRVIDCRVSEKGFGFVEFREKTEKQ